MKSFDTNPNLDLTPVFKEELTIIEALKAFWSGLAARMGLKLGYMDYHMVQFHTDTGLRHDVHLIPEEAFGSDGLAGYHLRFRNLGGLVELAPTLHESIYRGHTVTYIHTDMHDFIAAVRKVGKV